MPPGISFTGACYKERYATKQTLLLRLLFTSRLSGSAESPSVSEITQRLQIGFVSFITDLKNCRLVAADWFFMHERPRVANIIVEVLEATELRIADLNGK